MPRTTTLLGKAGLVLFGLILTLLGLELCLRATGWFFLQNRAASTRPALDDSNHYTVLCLGESTTADLAVWGAKSYPAQLEQVLNEGAEGIEFRVINGGVPATTTDRIVEKLPEDLERHDPDVVVAMMGINDGSLIDPRLQVGTSIRTWKLAKTLYYTYFGAAERAPRDPKDKSTQVLRFRLLSLSSASKRIFAGDFAGAEALLMPMLQGEGPESRNTRLRAYGAMAILNWQRGSEQEADHYHQEFLSLRRRLHSAITQKSYARMRRILSDRSIPLVAVQYPGRSVESLRQLIGPDAGVVFVDNEASFLDAMKSRPAGEVYRDLFAGIFGHLTPDGNRILAENVASAILSDVVNDPAREE